MAGFPAASTSKPFDKPVILRDRVDSFQLIGRVSEKWVIGNQPAE